MADQEFKYFNVKNTSIRLVNLGGVLIKPEEVVAIVDDEKGLNRELVDVDLFLEETDEDVTNPVEPEPEAKEAKPKAAAKKGSTKNDAATPTGAGWNAKT